MYGNTYSERGKGISAKQCSNLIVTPSAFDQNGSVITDGNDIAANADVGQTKSYDGNILICPQKPATVDINLTTCM